MKKDNIYIHLLINLVFFIQFINANEIGFDSGWQIRGVDSNISSTTILNNKQINSIWTYRNGKWYANFSKENNSSVSRFDNINKNEGFWIFANNSGSFNTPSTDVITKLSIKNGWNMYGCDSSLNHTTFDNENIKIVWAFKNKLNKWKAYSSDTQIMNLIKNARIEIIDRLDKNEGFWIKSTSNTEITLQTQQEDTKNDITLYGLKIYANDLSFDKYKLKPLSDNEFNSLSEDNKYLVANKLLGSLFYGLSYEELKNQIDSGSFISHIQQIFSREPDIENINSADEKINYYIHNRSYDTKRIAPIMARLYELKPSKYFIDNWTAYILTQTILFSPAYELATVNYADIMDVYRNLVDDFEQGFSIQWTTFTHTISSANWRRFRSPEDNGREMLEIYLMDFNDSHVPLAAQALKNWKLDRRSNSLEITFDKNRIPINNLFPNNTVTDGFDFYSKLVQQPNFIPTVTRRLVDKYFPNFTKAKKQEIVNKIVSSTPKKWQDILKQIVFSKEYLLNSKKIKTFEEAFYQIAKAIKWDTKYNTFSDFNYYLRKMHQATMKYKLGRKVAPPTDTQSFVWYTKAIRDKVLTNYENNTSLESSDDGWNKYELFKKFPDDLYGQNELRDDGKRLYQWYPYERKRASYMVNYLFISVAGRKPTEKELNFFVDLIDDEKRYSQTYDNYFWLDTYGNSKEKTDIDDRRDFIRLILDYLSRLDSVYIFKAVK